MCAERGCSMPQGIRVFVSYSGDDWDNFVEPMATSLRASGIDAITANWDLHPGESLVEWILEKELPAAEVVVIVLSQSSVGKPWVREELDHATVRRIEERIRLIPFRIDDCEVPNSLRTIKRISVHSKGEWDAKVQELIDAIYRTSRKPPLGDLPTYMVRRTGAFPGESYIEGLVLNAVCEAALQQGHYSAQVQKAATIIGESLSESQIEWAIRRLEARGVLKGHRVAEGGYIRVEIGLGAAAEYCSVAFPEFVTLQRRIGADIAEIPQNASLRYDCPDGIPAFIFRVAIDTLKSRGWFEAKEFLGGGWMIYDASPFIEDWLEEFA